MESHFEQIANSFTVKEIASPVDYVDSEWTRKHLYHELDMYGPASESLVVVGVESQVLGYLLVDHGSLTLHGMFGEPEGVPLKELAEPITQKILLASDTPLLDVIPLFKKNRYFFLLTKNQITHSVAFRDMDKLPFKLSFLALVVQLESQVLKLLDTWVGPLEARAEVLSEFLHQNLNQLGSAKRIWESSYGEKPYQKDIEDPIEEVPWEFIRCISFKNKMQLLNELLLSYDVDLGLSNKEWEKKFVDPINDLRNVVAHSKSIFTLIETPLQLNRIIDKTRFISKKLRGIIAENPQMKYRTDLGH